MPSTFNKSSKSRKAALEDAAEGKKRNISFGDMVIPSLGLVIFVILTVFVYVPLLFSGENSIITLRDEIDNTQGDIDFLNNKISQLDEIQNNRELLRANLENATAVVPDKLQVSQFAFYVDQIAEDAGLEFQQISSSEVEVTNGNDGLDLSGRVQGITGPSIYTGTYGEITEFLDNLQQRSPYIVNTSSISLSQDGDDGRWRVQINVTGYYVPEEDRLEPLNPTLPVSPYTSFEDTLEVFERKAGIIGGEEEL